MEINSPDGLDNLVSQIRQELESANFAEAAERFASIQGQAYTTSSEWLGDLRNAARFAQKQYRLPRDLNAKLNKILSPTFSERVLQRKLWQGILMGTILLILEGAVLVLFAIDQLERHLPIAVAIAVVLIVLLWVSVKKVSVCPGCAFRIEKAVPAWCPYCGMGLSTGSPGPQIIPIPNTPRSSLLKCQACGHAPGGRSRYGTPLRSEGTFCTNCGAHLGQ